MDLAQVLTAIDIAKKAIPALEALGSGLKPLASDERDDIKNAFLAVGKAVVDLKGGYEALEGAVKAAIAAQ